MNETGVLLIHGFGGGPWEVDCLKKYLDDSGYTVSVPLLPGHGRVPLEGVTADDWAAAVELAYLELAQQCARVFVVGFSMGGLLAVRLWHYHLAGVVTVNTPIYYWNIRRMVKNIVEKGFVGVKQYSAGASRYSAESLIAFQMLLFSSKGMFRQLRCPVLVVQASDDDIVKPRSAGYILGRIQGERLMVTFPGGSHQLLQSESGEKAARIIGRFIKDATAEEKKQEAI